MSRMLQFLILIFCRRFKQCKKENNYKKQQQQKKQKQKNKLIPLAPVSGRIVRFELMAFTLDEYFNF